MTQTETISDLTEAHSDLTEGARGGSIRVR